jgi:hypothetical protein
MQAPGKCNSGRQPVTSGGYVNYDRYSDGSSRITRLLSRYIDVEQITVHGELVEPFAATIRQAHGERTMYQ